MKRLRGLQGWAALGVLLLAPLAAVARGAASDVVEGEGRTRTEAHAEWQPASRELAPGAFSFPEAVTPGPGGVVYVADKANHRVVRVEADGGVSVVAGDGTMGFAGDGGPATGARLAMPEGVAVDDRGDVYVADTFNSRIRKIDGRTGRISTIVGTADVGDGGPAREAELSLLGSLAVSGDVLYVADTGHHRIRAVDLRRGVIRTIAGTGTPGFSGDGGPATEAQLFRPEFVAADPQGNLYVADTFNHRIRRVDRETGRITTVAGAGQPGYGGDGGAAVAALLYSPEGMAVDRHGHLYVADMGNDRVRRVEAGTGRITTVAGTGVAGFNGDGRTGVETHLNFPLDLAYDRARHALVISDLFNHRIRRLDLETGIVTTIAGNGEAGWSGDGGAAVAARLFNPEGILLDAEGNLFIADHTNHRVRRVDNETGVITTVAGSGESGFAGDGELAVEASLFSPSRLQIWNGQLFIAETANHVVRAVDLETGIIETAVGGTVGRPTGPATELRLALPSAVAVTGRSLYVADSGHHRVLRVDLESGHAETVLGTGKPGFGGDGGPGTAASVSLPSAVALGPSGELFVADLGNNRIRGLDPKSGRVRTVVVSGLEGFDRDGIPPVAARAYLLDVRVTRGGDLLVADMGNGRVRWLRGEGGELRTLVGQPGTVARGEPPPLYSLPFEQLRRIGLDEDRGLLYVSDSGGHRVYGFTLPPHLLRPPPPEAPAHPQEAEP